MARPQPYTLGRPSDSLTPHPINKSPPASLTLYGGLALPVRVPVGGAAAVAVAGRGNVAATADAATQQLEW